MMINSMVELAPHDREMKAVLLSIGSGLSVQSGDEPVVLITELVTETGVSFANRH